MNISNELLCLYSASVDQQGDSYLIEVPKRELQLGDIEKNGVYRVALISASTDGANTIKESSERTQPGDSELTPPVDEGDIREVDITGLGDQGDGVAKIDRGYVVIVPETEPGDTVAVEMQTVKQNFAIGETI